MPVIRPGNSSLTTKKRIPKVVHPLGRPGYLIVAKFIAACILNILSFVLTYSFLLVAIPIALIAKFVQKTLVVLRIKYQRLNAAFGNAGETYWFLTSHEHYKSNLIMLVAVKGPIDAENLECLLEKRLNTLNENGVEERARLMRLDRQPIGVFGKLVWIENATKQRKTVVQVDSENACLTATECNIVNLQSFVNSSEWQVYLYSNNGDFCESTDNLIVLRFDRCMADLQSLVYAVSKSLMDRQVYVFRDEITPAQAFCLGFMSLLAGPSIFARTLLKSKDLTFTVTPSTCRKLAVFYSKPIVRSDVEIVTTATGTSVSDVILSCLAGSLRYCLQQSGVTFPKDVTIYYPINLESSNALGRFTSFNIFSLPVGTEGAIPRLWEMRLRRSNVKSFVEAITTSSIMQLAFLILPSSFATWLMDYIMRRASCSVNSILGHRLDEDMLLDGRPVENFIPLEDRGYGLSITVIDAKDSIQLAVLAPSSQDYVIKPAQLCVEFARQSRVLSARLTQRAEVVRARGQKVLHSRRNSVFIVEENEEK